MWLYLQYKHFMNKLYLITNCDNCCYTCALSLYPLFTLIHSFLPFCIIEYHVQSNIKPAQATIVCPVGLSSPSLFVICQPWCFVISMCKMLEKFYYFDLVWFSSIYIFIYSGIGDILSLIIPWSKDIFFFSISLFCEKCTIFPM